VTFSEMRRLQRDLGSRALDLLGQIPSPLAKVGRAAVIDNLPAFVPVGLVAETRSVLASVDEREAQALRARLRRLVSIWERTEKEKGADSPNQAIADLLRWQADLQPADLAGRIRDLTSREYWEAIGEDGAEIPPESNPYEAI